MANPEVPKPIPTTELVGQKERLINKEFTGAQVLMLLGLVPEEARTLDKEKIKDSAEKAIPLEHKEKIKKASFNERKDYWEGKKDAMVTWRKGMDAFLDVYKTNNTDQVKKDGLLFLQKIFKKDGQELGDVKIDADNIYDTFMKDGEGDVEFFARRIADNKTITFDEIEKNQKLINNLGNIYGENSAKISELLTHGITNYKQDSEAFIASAQENINNGNYGEEGIWTVLDTNSKGWEEKVKLKKEAEEKQRQEKAAAAKAERLRKENEKKLDIGEKSLPKEVEEKDKEKYKNQDAVLSLTEKGVFAVFDGLGGNAAGDVASKLARETVLNNLKDLQDGLSEEEVEHHLKIALIGANTKVFNEAKKNNNDMASTGVVGYVLKDQDGKMKVIIGSVGDSRAYIQTKDGILKQITIDDNNVREKFKDDEKGARSMQEKLSNIETQLQFNSLTEDEQNLFKGRRNITQAIGHEENVAPNIYAQDFQEGDRLVFLTDGISDNLTDNEINKIISESKNSQEATEKLTEAASKRSKETGIRSKKDDMSAIVVGMSDKLKDIPQSSSSPTTSEKPKDLAQKPVGSEIKAPEVIDKEIDGAIEKYNKSDSGLVKKFVPILESLTSDHTSIPEEDYRKFVEKALGGFLLAEGVSQEKEKFLNFIGIFDVIYARYNELLRSNSKPDAQKYYKDRIDNFEKILNTVGVEKANNAVGEKFVESTMNKLGEKEVEEKDKEGIVLDEFIPGFTFKGEHLRRSSVGVGKLKETSDKT